MTSRAPLLLAVLASAALAACAGHRARQTQEPAPEPAAIKAVAAAPAPNADPAPPEPPAPASPSPTDLFARTVQPILARSCTPCHVPGGRMYDRLPFDNPEVVRSNKDGILRRLKAAEDRQAFEQWLAGAGRRD